MYQIKVERSSADDAPIAGTVSENNGSLRSIVIVGAGHGGFQTALSLRQAGFDGRIVLVGDEPGLPYQRPPLSKAYLLGKASVAALAFRPDNFFLDNRIDFATETRVSAIDRRYKRVTLASGTSLRYDHLVLALGLQNRTLPVPGADLDGVFGLRSLADADAVGAALTGAHDIVVVGAGFIGLEFAAAASSLGKSVHVFERADRAMARAVSPEISKIFADAHASWGTRIEFSQGLMRIEGDGRRVTGIESTAGRRYRADMVLFGIGALPNISLAQEADLDVENGIKVNAELLTSDPNISAVGDCASFPSPHANACVRLESVQNATDQARIVAKRLTGRPCPYLAVPWFWSDQRDLKLQIVGLPSGYDQAIVVGNPADYQMSVLSFRQDKLVAVQSVNRGSDHVAARKLLARGIPTLSPMEASRMDFDLKRFETVTGR